MRKCSPDPLQIAILPQFLAIEPHFVQKGCAIGRVKTQFYFRFWRSNLISCERVRRTLCKSQFYFSFWRSNLISRERVALGQAQIKIAILLQFLAIENPHFARKGSPDALHIAILPQFLAIEPHFVRKGCAIGRLKSQFYRSFWRSNLISCERVAFRAVSLALPRAFKREMEKKERARGQESKRECEDVKM